MRRAILPVVCVLSGTVFSRGASAADVTVGNGTGESCTEAALDSAVATVKASGGTITFNCPGAFIAITSTKVFDNPAATYTIDGGNNFIRLEARAATRILLHRGGTLNLRNISLIGGRASGVNDEANGGAIRSDNGVEGPLVLNLTNVSFSRNRSHLTGVSGDVDGVPLTTLDFGGGAVYIRGGHLTVTDCDFFESTAENAAGGAIHGRSSTIEVTDTDFSWNGWNGGGLGGGIYVDGVSPAGAGGSIRISTSTFYGWRRGAPRTPSPASAARIETPRSSVNGPPLWSQPAPGHGSCAPARLAFNATAANTSHDAVAGLRRAPVRTSALLALMHTSIPARRHAARAESDTGGGAVI